jgi:AraC-like DNA-binding protein
MPIRSSAFCAVLEYTHDPAHAPSTVDGKAFEYDAIVITTQGRWSFKGADGTVEIDSGSLVAGVAGGEYGCRHDPRTKSGDLVVALRPGALDPNYPPLFVKQIVPADSALRLARRAAGAVTADGFDSLVFVLFDEIAARSDRTSRRGIGSPLRMQRAKRFIELHAFERIGLAEIAAQVGLSPFTMAHQFRAATGQTPYGYLLELRLARAKQLLATTETPLTSIACTTGFGELSRFSRWFTKATGVAPSAYRARERS